MPWNDSVSRKEDSGSGQEVCLPDFLAQNKHRECQRRQLVDVEKESGSNKRAIAYEEYT